MVTPPPTPGTVAITGANGFIGSSLVHHFSGRGWRVLALCRGARDQRPLPGVTFREFSLPDGIREEDLAGGDVLVHCACVHYSKQHPDSDAINIRGTQRLLAISRSLGYARFIFLSSLSAHERAESHYGRHKRQLEQIFDPARDLVIRPGLTLGNGGLARAIVGTIRRSRVVPLVAGGRQPVYTIGVDDLCGGLEQTIERQISGLYSLAAPEPVTLRELYAGIAWKTGVRCTFVPAPYLPVFLALRAAELVGIELSITTENLLGLKHLRRFDLAADLQALDVRLRPFAETLQSLNLS